MSRSQIVDAVFEMCDALDWGNVSDAYGRARAVLAHVADQTVLRDLLDHVAQTPKLRDSCEKFNLFSKLVLLEGASGTWKLRLHVFKDEVLEAHHHRASFCAQVLRGSYTHMLFGAHATLDKSRLNVDRLRPLFIQEQEPGTSYMIDHDMVHSTLAKVGTTTLMLQGPTVRDAFEIFDLLSGTSRTRVGGKLPRGVQESGEGRISDDDMQAIISHLASEGVIA